MKKIISIVIFFFSAIAIFGQTVAPLSSDGLKLRNFYLNENVENLWIAGHHINWETGEPDKANATKGIKTHCSAFVASVCKQNNIYILRPPEHTTELLANAQYDWLFTKDARNAGWSQIKDSVFFTAQNLANMGCIVIAVAKNPNNHKPGHIAFVMPIGKTMNSLLAEGPTLIQAGLINSNSISLKTGFKHHISNWTKVTDLVAFFYNKDSIQ
ncbi:MAG: hypothetical protein DI598_09550 [Pseudopedobacter saltans]|uniref:Uncharacterized protein n=1 Tax=Pseudopedobacter saltans TaxID=151895 RepID=A0A2W5F4G2_9SPHI|nr:MAG: hypothetical protein DI598_09550 [Pseudopedobacter saltans]